MTWTRLDDNWMADAAFDRLDIPTRWHYLMMIQFCSRGKRYDGVMPLAEAEMCSTAADKSGILAKLIAAELVENVDGETLRVVRIDEHVPPPSVREAAAATRVRVARHRKHKNGDHSECLPEKCSHLGNASGNALHQDGDRDGPGPDVTGSTTPLDPDEQAMLDELSVSDLAGAGGPLAGWSADTDGVSGLEGQPAGV